MVLAEQDKEWMDGQMKAALKGYSVSWQTRQGSPYAAADLQRVSAGASSMIVLMRPEEGEVSCSMQSEVAGAMQQVLLLLQAECWATWLASYAGNPYAKIALPTCDTDPVHPSLIVSAG